MFLYNSLMKANAFFASAGKISPKTNFKQGLLIQSVFIQVANFGRDAQREFSE
jgi:hypothetical protein